MDVAEADLVTGPSLLATKRKEPPSSVGHAACRMRCCAADGVAAPAEHLHPPLGKTSGIPANGRVSACHDEGAAFEFPPELDDDHLFGYSEGPVMHDYADEDAFGFGGDLGEAAYYS